MLRIIQQSNAAAAKSYYSHSDYYVGGERSSGIWGGKGAEKLGLDGTIGRQDFELLCDNKDPRTGEMLTSRTSHKRTVLYDWNFHVPKGITLLGIATGDERLQQAIQDSVRETMDEAEADMKVRVRKRNRNEERTTGNMVWAGFFHQETRPSREDGLPDPHWHWHVCVMNATYDDKESQWKAGQFRDLKADAPYFEAAFHARLAKRVADLGYDIRRKGRGGRDWDVDALPEKLLKKFSRRSNEIEKLAEELGVTDPKEKDGLGAKSRKSKLKAFAPDELRAYWLGRMTPAERAAIDGAAKLAESQEGREREADNELAAAYGIKQSFERESVVDERKVYVNALRFGLGRVTPEGVKEQAKDLGLLTRERDGRRLATTKEALQEEKELLDFARDGRGTCKPLAPGEHQFTHQELDEGQRRAVDRLLASTDRVTMLVGKAGVGKTTLLSEAVDAIKATGKEVHAFAPSSDASFDVLRSEGFPEANTVARLLVDPKFQARLKDQALLVDEAGQLGSPALRDLFKIAKRENARVILVGDPKQHKSVERGAPLRLLEAEAGVKPIVVWDIKRQKGEYKEAVAALSDGRTLEGLERLNKLGWIKELPDGDRDRQLAKDYVAALNSGQKVLAISPTHAEGAAITAAIRDELKRTGGLAGGEKEVLRLISRKLTEAERSDPFNYATGDVVEFHQNAPGFIRGERAEIVAVDEKSVKAMSAKGDVKPLPLKAAKQFTLYRKERIRLGRGDQVRITKPGKSINGRRLNNGTTARVVGFETNGDLKLDNGAKLARDFGHLSHGYCLTSHAAQGKTVKHQVFVAQSSVSFPASSPEQAYVSASRARQRVTIYTDSRAKLFEAVGKSREPLSATELIRDRRETLRERRKERLRRLRVGVRQMAAMAFAEARERLGERALERQYER